jgi:ABC-2 type transport system ATP-binding protein
MITHDSRGLAIEAIGLRKRFGAVLALDDVTFTAERGTILGMLGPNGSGKSTTVRALTTLLRPDVGTGRVNGIDVLREPERARTQFGLAGQYASVDEMLSGRNNLILIGELYQMPARDARRRADELLERFDLVDAAGRVAGKYSGGMRRRLDLAASLMATPPVLFLDEPTTGLDPRSRLAIWEVISGLASDGTTVLQTTQYLEEADRLADRIVVMDRGHVIADDTPTALKRSVGGEQIVITLRHLDDLLPAREALAALAPALDPPSRELVMPAVAGGETLTEVMRILAGRNIALEDIAMRRPTLDEVFLELTGAATTDDDKEVA